MAERDDMDPDDAPVTRREFRQEVAKLATKDELAAAVAKLATKDELAAAVAKLATKDELAAAVAKLATKDELQAGLETWAGALEARFEARMDAKFTAFEQQMSAGFAQLGVDLARHTQAIVETLTTQVSALDDKYKDLPPRVAKLEDIEARRAARRRGPRQS